MGVQNNFQVEIDKVDRQEWSHYIGMIDDATILQTWDFPRCICPSQKVSRIVLRRNGEICGLAQVRILEIPLISRGIAYVSYGPVWQKCGTLADIRIFKALIDALKGEYAKRRKLLLRILPSLTTYEEIGIESVLAENGYVKNSHIPGTRTILLNLDRPLDDIRKSFHSKTRQKLNKAERTSLDIRHGNTDEYYANFLPVYREILTRKNIELPIDAERWGRLLKALPASEKPEVFLVYHEGNVVASMVVCAAMGNTGFPIALGTAHAGLKLNVTVLLWWHVIEWLKESGCVSFDLWGINPETNPGGYRFKRRFGGKEVSRLGVYENCQSRMSGLSVRIAEVLRNTGLNCIQPLQHIKSISQRSISD